VPLLEGVLAAVFEGVPVTAAVPLFVLEGVLAPVSDSVAVILPLIEGGAVPEAVAVCVGEHVIPGFASFAQILDVGLVSLESGGHS
jgi:hypothetical protein